MDEKTDVTFSFNPQEFVSAMGTMLDSISMFNQKMAEMDTHAEKAKDKVTANFKDSGSDLKVYAQLFGSGISDIIKGKEADWGLLKDSAKGAISSIMDMFAQVETTQEKTHSTIRKQVKDTSVSVANFGKGANQMVNALTMRLGALTGIYFSIRGMMSAIPEIGRTFSIAGDIFMRNFFYPLRELLVPMLQKLLDWTRDHRSMFVRWGTVVANVFRAVVAIVKTLWQTMKQLWEGFVNSIQRVFGVTLGSMTDLANLLLVKITATIMYLQILLEPVFKFIVDGFVQILAWGKAFWQGISIGFQPVIDIFGEMWKSVLRIAEALGMADGQGGFLTSTFKTLGAVLAMLIVPLLEAVSSALDGASIGIQGLAEAWATFKALTGTAHDKAVAKQLSLKGDNMLKGYQQRRVEGNNRIEKVWKEGISTIGEAWTAKPELNAERKKIGDQINKSEVNIRDVKITVRDKEEAVDTLKKISSGDFRGAIIKDMEKRGMK